MSASHSSKPDAHGYRHDLMGYLTGFVLAVVLTVIPFAMVAMGDTVDRSTVIGVVALLGVVQLFVHLRYFLHVDFSPEEREKVYLLAFSALLLFIMAAGTIWVLINMNARMMNFG